MVIPKPVPDALWQRLAAFDARCDCFMSRDTEYLVSGTAGRAVWSRINTLASPTPTRRAWHVRITLRPGGYGSLVHVAEPTLADALAAAVGEAERRGWHRPHECAPATPR